MYVSQISLNREQVPSFHSYPFDLEVVRSFTTLKFQQPVTFLVGENGTGKSTLLEAMAIAMGFNPEGGSLNMRFQTESSHSELYQYMRVGKKAPYAKDGFFLRAESYYNVASHIDQLDREEGPGMPIRYSYGGKSLHEQSHGEAFWSTFLHRFGGNGLYMLDEPEAALSPLRQMSFLARMHQLVKDNSQFIIATHSPILMSYPDADIITLDRGELRKVALEETDHFAITHSFMTGRERMLRELLQDEEQNG
ncbi:AAA family ATPase [Paenibacillus agilis]|nr:AAA family ATPase [Paenibacillus agilis]